ncbi:hypothetical protein FB451DRAFT_1281246 [Mycena latifolia]|nr:hypothetical protein FB451DRAFT_1281246 [Mycena latifolia]
MYITQITPCNRVGQLRNLFVLVLYSFQPAKSVTKGDQLMSSFPRFLRSSRTVIRLSLLMSCKLDTWPDEPMQGYKYVPGLARKIPIFADTGIYCASHALKLLALGFSLASVGLGRPCGAVRVDDGQAGVEKARSASIAPGSCQ